MVWSEIGTLAPTLEWRTFNTPVVGGELFRCRQEWVGDWPGTGYLQLSAFYADGGRYGYQQAQASRTEQMFLLPVPEALEIVGFTVRYMALRHNSRARLYANANWRVSVDQWI